MSTPDASPPSSTRAIANRHAGRVRRAGTRPPGQQRVLSGLPGTVDRAGRQRLLNHDPRTRAYVTRRTAQGKSKREIIRCLKRYVARDIFKDLNNLIQPLDKQ